MVTATRDEAADDAGTPTLASPVAESRRLAETAAAERLVLRLLGGVAVHLLCPRAAEAGLRREYHDIDCVVKRRHGEDLKRFLKPNGYEPDERFNAFHGETRLMFHDRARDRHVDVFLGVFAMCHTLNLEPRLNLPGPALNPADLLLTKLQIVELNRKDVQDALALLLDFPPAREPSLSDEVMDVDRLVHVCARDWGWYVTFLENVQQIADRAGDFLPPSDAGVILERTGMIRDTIERAHKSLSWRMRAKVGRKLPWYELPEEVKR